MTWSLCVFLPNNFFFSPKKSANFPHLTFLCWWDSSKGDTKNLLADSHSHWSTQYVTNLVPTHPRPKQHTFVYFFVMHQQKILLICVLFIPTDDSFCRLRLFNEYWSRKIKQRKLSSSCSSQQWFCEKFDFNDLFLWHDINSRESRT